SFMLLPLPGPVELSTTASGDTENEFSDGSDEVYLNFEKGGIVRSANFTLPDRSIVSFASLKIQGKEYLENYPFSPKLYIGNDTEPQWAFDGKGYGPLGEQMVFENGQKQEVLNFEEVGEENTSIVLPKNAEIKDASVDLEPINHRNDSYSISDGIYYSVDMFFRYSVTDGKGHIFLYGKGAVHSKRSDDYGQTWENLSYGVQAVSDNISYSLSKDSNPPSKIIFRNSRDYGDTWENETVIVKTTYGWPYDYGFYDSAPKLLRAHVNHVYVMWVSLKTQESDVEYGLNITYSDDHGRTWNDCDQIERYQKVAINNFEFDADGSGNVYVAYEKENNILFKKSIDHGKTWPSQSTKISDSEETEGKSKYPVMRCNERDGIYIAWKCGKRIYFRSSDNGAITWNDEKIIATGTDRADAPSIDMDSDGKLYLIYRLEESGVKNYYINTSSDRGQTWSKGQIFCANNSGGSYASLPGRRISVTDRIYVCYSNRTAVPGKSDNVKIVIRWANKSDSNDFIWSEEKVSNEGLLPAYSFAPALASRGAEIYTTFTARGDPHGIERRNKIFFRKSEDNGKTWSDLDIFPHFDTTGRGKFSDIATEGNHVYLLWNLYGYTYHQYIYFMRSDDYGENWTTPKKIGPVPPTETSRPNETLSLSLAVDGDNIYAAWASEEKYEDKRTVKFRYSADRGEHWGDVVTIANTNSISNDKSNKVGIIGKGSFVGILYRISGNLYYNYSVDYGRTWSGPFDLSACESEKGAAQPSITLENGRIYAVWRYNGDTSNSGDDLDIYMRYSDDCGQTWSERRLISTNSNLSSYYPLVRAEENNVIVIWEDRFPGTDSANINFTISVDKGEHWEFHELYHIPDLVRSGNPVIPSASLDSGILHYAVVKKGTTDIYDRNDTIHFTTRLLHRQYAEDVQLKIGSRNWDFPGTLETTYTVNIKSALETALETAPSWVDEYGNEMCRIPIQVESDTAGYVWLTNLSISYDYSPEISLNTTALNALIPKMGDGETEIILNLTTESAGGLHLFDLDIRYRVNQVPVARLDVPESWPVNVSVVISAENSTNDCTIVSYYFDFGDGTNLSTDQPVVQHTYTEVGNYLIRLRVEDNNSAWNWTEKNILNFTTEALKSVKFNASGSYDHNNDNLSYSWDFGDGTHETGMVVQHVFQHKGNYTVTLTVSDGEFYSHDTLNVTVLQKHDAAFNIPAMEGESGMRIYYNFTITNTGSDEDTFYLSAFPSDPHSPERQYDWGIIFTPQNLTLIRDKTTMVLFSCLIPEGHPPKSIEFALNASNLSAFFNLTVLPTYGFEILEGEFNGTYFDQRLELEVIVKNTGNIEENLHGKLDLITGWNITVEPEDIELAPGENHSFYLFIEPPADALAGNYSLTFQAWVKESSLVEQSVGVLVRIPERHDVRVYAPFSSKDAEKGEMVQFIVTIENTGNCEETIELSVSEGTLDRGWLTLESGEKAEVTVSFTPEDSGNYSLVFTARYPGGEKSQNLIVEVKDSGGDEEDHTYLFALVIVIAVVAGIGGYLVYRRR
ncbi:MAG: exo-alpha-sialidase, partial [Thermoplasmata archaeon]|nr:exo-alpha-sialidase [Thermoplasmata archaeon]